MTRSLGLVLALVWALARAAHAGPVAAVAGVLLANLVPGLALVRLAGYEGRPLAWRLAAAGTVSPPLLAAIGILAGFAGAPLERVAMPVIALAIAVLAWPRDARAVREPGAPIERVLVAAGALLAAGVAVALLHPRLPRWSDSWFHAAVFHEVQRAGVHPTFPHFADMPLPYPWFFHVYLVMLAPLVHPDPFVLMATVNEWTAFLIPVVFFALARALGAPTRVARWAPVAGFLGVNPLGPLVLVARANIGKTTGGSFWHEAFANADLVQGALAFRYPGFQTAWLSRLWTPTAFNFALVLAAFVLVLALEFARAPGRRALAAFAVVLALLLHWHTLTALQLCFGIAAATAAAALPRLRADGLRALAPGLALAAAMLAGFAVARPYLALVTLGGSAPVMRLAFGRDNAFGLVVSMGPVLLGALAGLAALEPRVRAWALGGLAGLALPMLAFDLPGAAEEKLWWPLFLLAAPLAAFGIDRLVRSGRAGRLALAALVCSSALTTAITARAFLGDPRSMREMFDAAHPGLAPFYTPDEARALAFVREHTPRDAVFLQPLRPAGTEPLLVHGERRLWLGFADVFYRATFFERPGRPPIPLPVWAELQRRDALQRRAFGDSALATPELDSLRARPWPVYVWWDTTLAHGRLSPTLADTARVTREVFASPTVRVLELRR